MHRSLAWWAAWWPTPTLSWWRLLTQQLPVRAVHPTSSGWVQHTHELGPETLCLPLQALCRLPATCARAKLAPDLDHRSCMHDFLLCLRVLPAQATEPCAGGILQAMRYFGLLPTHVPPLAVEPPGVGDTLVRLEKDVPHVRTAEHMYACVVAYMRMAIVFVCKAMLKRRPTLPSLCQAGHAAGQWRT